MDKKERFKKWANAYLSGVGIDINSVPVDDIYKDELSLSDNKSFLKIKYPIPSPANLLAMNSLNELDEEKMTKMKIENEELELLEKEKRAVENLTNTSTSVMTTSESPIVKHQNSLRALISNVVNGFSTSLFIVSKEVGIGKTRTILTTMEELGLKINEDYSYFSGYTTPLAIYEYLYMNRNKKIIVFDDIDTIFKNSVALTILKNTTQDTTDVRTVAYKSSRELSVPSQFEITARVIFISNKIPDNIMTKALMSRSLYYEIRISFEEKVALMKDFVKIPYKNTTEKQRKEALDYLLSKNPRTFKEFNFRTLNKVYNIMLQFKEQWVSVADNILNTDEDALAFVVAERESTTKEAIHKFKELTGLGERTYYRIKRKMYGSKVVGI